VAARRRLAPLLLVALGAFGAGVVVGAGHQTSGRRAAAAFAAAWERRDYAAMHRLLSDDARRRTSLARLARTYRAAAATLTLERVDAGRPGRVRNGAVAVPVKLETRIFGRLGGALVLPLARRGDGDEGIEWRANLVFPGLRRGERLSRTTELPPRAAIQARDGRAIAQGPERASELGPLAASIAGSVGAAPPERAAALAKRGIPPGARVGLTGLERVFDDRLTGTPGGTLKAGRRVLARAAPRPGHSVRTTIDPDVQAAAVTALAGRFGGVAVIRPRDGEVLGLAGIAYSAPQPPGSTFKIVTLAAALEAGVARPSSRYPIQTSTTLEGVELRNANDEACGGSLQSAFATSCNSVFAPLGARLGARRLVAAAERFGFNEDPGIAGAARSTIPAAGEIGDDLAVGSSAIGQGKVLATPLQMAVVAAAIGEHGRRVRPTLLKGAGAPPVRATTPAVARVIGRFMRAVVTSGTGSGAAVPGVKVAGKTGTAELRTTVTERPRPGAPAPPPPPPVADRSDTDAWFTAYAPVRSPRVAVCVLLVGQGAGGATAAPAARAVIEAALTRPG
jgi:cell division protein FtsI/penicillin-binding protein 2